MQSIVQLSGPVPTMWWSTVTALLCSVVVGMHAHLVVRVCLCPESSIGYTWIMVLFCCMVVLVVL